MDKKELRSQIIERERSGIEIKSGVYWRADFSSWLSIVRTGGKGNDANSCYQYGGNRTKYNKTA